MVRSLHFWAALIVALSSVQATVVREADVARLLSAEGRAAATVITVVTSTASVPTTITKT